MCYLFSGRKTSNHDQQGLEGAGLELVLPFMSTEALGTAGHLLEASISSLLKWDS